jgi:hypothetical protein
LSPPDKPTNLAENAAQRTSSSLGLTWSAPAVDGGSEVIDYRLHIAELNGVFSVLDTTSNEYYLANGLTAGTTYEFKIEARN